MSVAGLEGVSKRYAGRQVLDRVTLGVAGGDRVGVVGRNGGGKSTLLRVLAGVEPPDDGEVVHARGARLRFLAQDPPLPPGASALEAVLATEAGFDPLADRAGVQREARALALLDQLAVAGPREPVAGRSGGERKRIALAATLVDDAEVLVLDEPTNHLDVDAIEWLEQRLAAWPRALVLVSHDRYLLDAVVERVVEIDGGRLHTHAGGYAGYLEGRALRAEQAEAAERKRANRARIELAWLRRGPKARTSKAAYRLARAHEVVEAAGWRPEPELRIDLPSPRLGGKVVNLHGAGKRYGDRWVLRGIDHKLAPDARMGLVGPNGSGKTTLLRLLAGAIAPDAGSVRAGETVRPGYVGQEPPDLPARTRVLDAVAEVVRSTALASGARVTAAQLCERFLFDAAAQRAYVSELSGGERRRLELLRVLAAAPNLLLLDEPTNDLDLDTLAVLEGYLDEWEGALVVASHDRFFLERTGCDLWSLEPAGEAGGQPGAGAGTRAGARLRHHPDGYAGYRAWRRERSARAAGSAGGGGAGGRAGGGGAGGRQEGRRARKRSYREERELSELERRVPALEERRDDLSRRLTEAGERYAEATALATELSEVLAELERCEQRWLELSVIGED